MAGSATPAIRKAFRIIRAFSAAVAIGPARIPNNVKKTINGRTVSSCLGDDCRRIRTGGYEGELFVWVNVIPFQGGASTDL